MCSQSFQQKGKVQTFRCFRRKGYALFAALGREIRIGVLSAATLGSAVPSMADKADRIAARLTMETDTSSFEDTLLDEAVIQAAHSPVAASRAAVMVTTLSRKDLDAAGVTTVNDLLKLAACADVRQRGGFGMQTDISLDGGTFDQVAILLNGISLQNPQTGHNAADFPVNVEDIERVEILGGASSRLFGTQAFCGAINIVTRHSGSPLEASISGGSYGTFLTSARTVLPLSSRFTSTLSAGFRRSDGAVENGDFQGGRLFWQGRYADPSLVLDAQAGFTANDFGANTFYSAAYPDQWESLKRYLLSVRVETKGHLHLVPKISWLRNSDHFKLVRTSRTGENFHRGDVYTAGISAWTDWKLGRTAIGTEFREEGIYSTNLGRLMEESQQKPIHGEDGIRYTRKDSRTLTSYFLEHNILLSHWTFSAGILAQRVNTSGQGFRFYPGMNISRRIGNHWKVYASWNLAGRLPTFTDLWYKSPTQEGNVNLRPEKSSSLRAGTSWVKGIWNARAQIHYSHCTDLIDWVMYHPEDIYHATSFRTDDFGAELSAELDFGKRTDTPFLKRIRLDYAWLCRHRLAGEDYYKSNYAMEYLRHKLTVSLTHRIVDRLTGTWTLSLKDREGSYLLYRNGTSTGELHDYGLHATLDCRLSWDAPRYTLFVDLTNLTATRYFDLANVRQPGFLIMGGLGYRLPEKKRQTALPINGRNTSLRP